jgi:transmembrane sensor
LQASTERIAAWREGKLRFDNWRLAEAIDEYNRYASKPIHLAAPQLADVRITGVFRIGDSGAFVTALGELVGATVEDAGATLELKVP